MPLLSPSVKAAYSQRKHVLCNEKAAVPCFELRRFSLLFQIRCGAACKIRNRKIVREALDFSQKHDMILNVIETYIIAFETNMLTVCIGQTFKGER